MSTHCARSKRIAHKAVNKQLTNDQICARLAGYSRRLWKTAEQATSLHAVFLTLNNAALKARKREKLWGPIAGAYNVIQHALLRELILIIVRVLDEPRNLEKSDKVSFVVIGRWLERDGICEALVENARERNGARWARRNAAITRHAIRRLKLCLQRLANEDPNRERLLRNFRDDLLAHELHREIPRDEPMFGHIMEMVKEIQGLSSDALTACSGHQIEFGHVAAEAKDGAKQLWRAIAERKFTWHPKSGVEDL